jgi:protein phosphatase 2C
MNECPPHGCKSVMGRRAKMEDTFVAIPHLLDIAFADSMNEIIPPRIQDQLKTVRDGANGAGDLHLGGLSRGKIANESLHFFGVFDGHGGADAADHCKDTMHERLKEVILASELGHSESESADAKDENVSGKQGDLLSTGGLNTELLEKSPTSNSKEILFNLSRVSTSSEMAARHGTNNVDGVEKDEDENGDAVTANCSSEAISNALAKAFKLTDEAFAELGNEEELSLVGTTAVVALISSRSIYVANTGDSRAVLSRNGRAAALTDDHKAAREDETARVEAAGGQILFWNGVRVMGLLAVSRAIGDHSLRPYVIADPELTVVNRHPGDELLVLASDGLWDVMSNQEACALAKKCLLRARQKGSTRESAARVAATVLTRAAVDRGSRDNVTVLVIDLMQDPDDLLEADALKLRLSGEIAMDQNCIDSKSSDEKETIPIAAEKIEKHQDGGEDDTASADKTINVETSMKLEDPPPPPLEIGLSGSFRSPFEMMDDPFNDK